MQEDVSLQLSEILPRDFVPFFFFDGEQIRELAEAEEAVTASAIERILNLSFVGELEQGVSEFVRQRKREALPEETQVQIKRAEGELATNQAEKTAADKKYMTLQEDIHEDETRKRQLNAEQDELRTGVSDADRQLLEQRMETLESIRQDLSRKISETLPPEAPFIANLELTLHAYKNLETVVSVHTARQLGKLDTLCRELPHRLLDEEPHPEIPLDPSQIDHFRKKLQSILNEFSTPKTVMQMPHYLRALDLANAQSLRDRFLIWAREGAKRRDSIAIDLRRMRQLTMETERMKEELAKISVASEGHLQRFHEISKEIENLDDDLAAKYEEVGKIEAKISQCESTISETLKQIKELEEEHEQAQMTSQVVQYARNVGAVLRKFRSSQRELRRASVETRINAKLSTLLAEHGQIGHVNLSSKFIMTYYNNYDEKIGRASISAGMKQLVATALLWALKDESGKKIPLVIDTPFARIDRRNRAATFGILLPQCGGAGHCSPHG